ncbi:hypothetical protein ASE68_09500 [Agromyces sp. Leaf222]|nr:hypothetical protein ASE68_09500 [Agromyces sp. Leaf222]
MLTHIQGGFMSEETVPEPPEGLSTKGKSTIELFELDDPGLLTSWRKEHDAWTMQRISEALSPADLALLLRAVREAEGLGPEH